MSLRLECFITAFLIALTACGDDESSDQVAKVCQPGDQKACACPGGAQGAQACRQDGAGWGACLGCSGTGGSATDGSAGGSAPDASAGGSAGEGGAAGVDAATGGSEAGDASDSAPSDDGACELPWADCDKNAANGCETDLSASVENCGQCWLSCNAQVNNSTAALCVAGDAGQSSCDYVACAADYWDLDGNRQNGCEYYCLKKAESDSTCDNVDDDCDGVRDDGVDKCTDVANCGFCGRSCARPHAVGKCVPTPSEPCDDTHTSCVIDHCEAGWEDLNDSVADGCEAQVP